MFNLVFLNYHLCHFHMLFQVLYLNFSILKPFHLIHSFRFNRFSNFAQVVYSNFKFILNIPIYNLYLLLIHLIFYHFPRLLNIIIKYI